MEEKKNFYQLVEELCSEDTRYKPDAYEFLMQALHFTQGRLNRKGHLNGKELAEGLREFAIEQYGPMVQTVLEHWGVRSTADLGNIVFNMIDKKLLSKTEEDSLEDFRNVYDFKDAFGSVLRENVLKALESLAQDAAQEDR
jgi:uncharacterized repeat protein (TIGR04138 family)